MPGLTPEEEREEERRRLLEGVDFSALERFDGATSAITGPQAPAPPAPEARQRASRDPIVLTEPIVISRSRPQEPSPEAPAEPPTRTEPQRDPMTNPMTNPWANVPGARITPSAPSAAAPAAPAGIEERAERAAIEELATSESPPPSPVAPAQPPSLGGPPPSASERAAALGTPFGEPDGSAEALPAGKTAAPEGPDPYEAELARAREGDIPRRLLHNLANAFRALGGGTPSRNFVRDEDRVRARQRQEIADKRLATREQRQNDAQDAARLFRERDLEARAAQASERSALQRAQLSLQEREAGRRDVESQLRLAQLREGVERARSERAYEEAMRDPSSDVSARRRTVTGGLVASLPEGDRERVMQALGSARHRTVTGGLIASLPEGDRAGAMQALGSETPDGQQLMFDRLSALDLDELREDLPRFLRNGLRAGRGGRGGGGGQRSTWGTDEDPLVQAQIDAGVDERVARIAARDPRMRRKAVGNLGETDVRFRRQDEIAEEHARIPGFERAADARRLTARESQEASRVAIADREFRAAVAQLEQDLGSLTAAERARGVYGLGGERYARIEHALDVVRNQLRQINNAGNSLGAQEMAEHSVPGLTHHTTADAILANVRAAQRIKHLYVTSLLEQLGYRAMGGDGGGHGRGGGHASQPAPPPAEGERVAIILPDGRRARVPASQVEAAIARGARRAE